MQGDKEPVVIPVQSHEKKKTMDELVQVFCMQQRLQDDEESEHPLGQNARFAMTICTLSSE